MTVHYDYNPSKLHWAITAISGIIGIITKMTYPIIRMDTTLIRITNYRPPLLFHDDSSDEQLHRNFVPERSHQPERASKQNERWDSSVWLGSHELSSKPSDNRLDPHSDGHNSSFPVADRSAGSARASDSQSIQVQIRILFGTKSVARSC